MGSINVSQNGEAFVFAVLNAFLFGVTSIQISNYYYSPRGRTDHIILKCTILVLWILNLVATIANIYNSYLGAVLSFTNPSLPSTLNWGIYVGSFVTTLHDSTISTIFIYRIWRFVRSPWPWFILLPEVLIATLTGIALTPAMFAVQNLGELSTRFQWLLYFSFISRAIADITIMISMCAVLLRHRSQNPRTNKISNELVAYSITTCILTDSVALAVVIILSVSPHSPLYIDIASLISKMLAISLLAQLNSRQQMLKRMMPEDPIAIHLSDAGQSQIRTDSNSNTSQLASSSKSMRLDASAHNQTDSVSVNAD